MAQNKINEILKIDGMSCSGCELRIEEKLKSIPGVLKVTASFSKGTVHVAYNPDKITHCEICKAILELGYSVKEQQNRTQNVEKSGGNTSYILGTVLVLAALYMLIQHTVGFGFINFIPQINQNMSYGILFVVGLLTSIHCLAMCGGINLSQCVASQTGDIVPDKPNMKKRLMPSLLYNTGRVIVSFCYMTY